MNKELLKLKILQDIFDSKLDFSDSIEVLANVFIDIGLRNTEIKLKDKSKLDIVNETIKDIKENGDTLPNSLIRQGLLMLTWLEKSKEKYE